MKIEVTTAQFRYDKDKINVDTGMLDSVPLK